MSLLVPNVYLLVQENKDCKEMFVVVSNPNHGLTQLGAWKVHTFCLEK